MNNRLLNLLFAGALLFLNACAPATPTASSTESPATPEPSEPTAMPTPVHLKVGALSYLSHSPVHIALAEGYFAEQGLDVELVDFGTSDRDMLPAMLNKQLDIAAEILTTAQLHAMEEDGNIKYVADKGFSNPDSECVSDGFVARKELLDAGTLDTPDGLRGLKITNSLGNAVEYATHLMLAKAGLTTDDMQLIDMRDQLARLDALGNGSLDLYGVSEPWLTRATNTGNAGVWKSFAEFLPNFSFATITFGPSMLERDDDVGARFMLAYLKAVDQFSEGKTDRNVEIIAGFTQLSPEEVRQLCWTPIQRDGRINPQGLLDFQTWALQQGYIDGPLTIEQMWDPQYVDQANAIRAK